MAQAIIYCDRCGKIIPPSEIGRGRAIVNDTSGLCPACVAGISPEEREELRRRLSGEAQIAPAPQATARAPSTRALRRAEGADGPPEPAEQPRSHTGLVVAGLAAGVLGGVAIAVLIAGGDNDERASGPDAPATRPAVAPAGPGSRPRPPGSTPKPPETPAEPATPAARRIVQIKSVFDPSFANYTEGRKTLRAFLKEFPGTPEAEQAKARLAEMSIGETARAKEALAKAAERAKRLVSRGWFDDAGRAFDGARERLGENEWFKSEGEKKIASVLEGIEKARLDAAGRAVARAKELLGGERFDEARSALADRAGWPDEIRRRAEKLLEKIASVRAAAEEKRRRVDAWLEVLIGLNEAGETSLARARTHLESGRKQLRELGLARDKLEKLERIERRFRPAKFVEDIAEIALQRTKGTVRFRWKGETIAAKVASVEGGVLKVRTIGGKEETVPISEMAAQDVIAHARVMRGSSKDPVKAGSYYFLRGDVEAARKVIDGLASDAALALVEDIDLVASAFEERKARRIAAAEAAKRASEAAEAARKKAALDAALAKGLVAYWKFDETAGAAKAEDETAGYEGKLSDTVRMPGAEGKIGGAYAFDGNDVVTTDLGGFNEDFTWTAWIKTSNKNGAVVGNSEPGWSAGGKAFYVYGGKPKVDIGWVTYFEGNTVVNDGEWHHMAMTAEFETAGGNDTVKIYVDGELDATKANWDINKPERNHRIRIGHVAHQGKYFTGLIDEVRVYKRALAAKEIKRISEGRVLGLTPSTGPTEGLVGHWTFDSEDNPGGDSSGKGLHGKLFGPKWTAKGKVGGALEFDGERSFVDLPDGFADFTRGLTFAVWAYPTAVGNYARFIDIGNGPASDNILFARIGNSESLTLEAYQGGGRRSLGANDVLALDSWQHFVGTLDASGKATVYRDGVEIASGQMPLPQNVTRTSNYIGRSNWDGNRFYQGLMDDLRVYNRALSAEEAKALFEGKAGPVAAPPPAAPALVGHWKFDEGRGAAARDSSGKGRDGEIKGATWTRGKLGGALEFDGKNAYVQVGAPDVPPPWTAAMWVRRRDDGDAGALLDSPGCSLRLEQGNDCVGFTRYKVADYHFGHAVPVGVWTHLAFVGTASGTTLYVDGVRKTRAAAAIRAPNAQGPAVISAPMAGIGGSGRVADRMKGALDDVRIYNYALSDEKIKALFGGAAVTGAAVTGPGVTEPKVSLPTWPKEPLPGETGKPGEWAPGLVCEIFKGLSFKDRVGVRIDPSPIQDLGKAPPDLGLEPGDYSFRWSGYFLAPVTGQYFFDRRTGFTNVKIDGKNVYGERNGVELAKGLHEFRARAKGVKTEINFRMPEPKRNLGELCYHSVPEPGSLGPFAKLVRGLAADYLQGRRRVSTGGVRGTNFDAGDGPVCTAVRKDGFAVRMKGYLVAPSTGKYSFELKAGSNDLARVVVGGTVLFDAWAKPVKGVMKASRDLPAGLHGLDVSFVDKSGSAKLDLKWKRAGHNKMEPIPQGYFMREAAKPELVSRKGLAPGARCRIYKGAFSKRGKPFAERPDVTLRHDWGGKDPAPGVPRGSEFNVTWSGALVIPKTGRYSFSMQRYGAARLVVGGRRVIDAWNDKSKREPGGPVVLRAGTAKLQLDYFHVKGRAGVELYWSGPDFPVRPVGARDLAHEGEFAPAGPETKPKEQPQEKPTPAEPDPGKTPGAAPAANLVENGGFEEAGSSGEIARGWRKGQWGPKKGGFTARLDRTNSHGGGRSLVLRANGDGIHPGAATTLTSTLEPGKYEIRFWASADVGKTADVRAHLAGRDVLSESVGEDWKQFSATVEITGKKSRPSLRLYTTATKVRVWFDDVAVRAQAGP